jgi:hypothetical protein
MTPVSQCSSLSRKSTNPLCHYESLGEKLGVSLYSAVKYSLSVGVSWGLQRTPYNNVIVTQRSVNMNPNLENMESFKLDILAFIP